MANYKAVGRIFRKCMYCGTLTNTTKLTITIRNLNLNKLSKTTNI